MDYPDFKEPHTELQTPDTGCVQAHEERALKEPHTERSGIGAALDAVWARLRLDLMARFPEDGDRLPPCWPAEDCVRTSLAALSLDDISASIPRTAEAVAQALGRVEGATLMEALLGTIQPSPLDNPTLSHSTPTETAEAEAKLHLQPHQGMGLLIIGGQGRDRGDFLELFNLSTGQSELRRLKSSFTRSDFASCVGPDGCFLVSGGRDAAEPFLSSSLSGLRPWEAGELPVSLRGHRMAALGNSVFLCGGSSSTQRVGKTSPKAIHGWKIAGLGLGHSIDSWRKAHPSEEDMELDEPTCKAYVMRQDGGWAPIAPMMEPRIRFGLASDGAKLYAVGGSGAAEKDNLRKSAEAFCYEPSIDRWSRIGKMAEPVEHCQTVFKDGCLFAIGTHKASWIVSRSTVQILDPRVGKWDLWAPKEEDNITRHMNCGKPAYAGCNMQIVNDRIICIGGLALPCCDPKNRFCNHMGITPTDICLKDETRMTEVWELDPRARDWVRLPLHLRLPSFGSAVVVVDARIRDWDVDGCWPDAIYTGTLAGRINIVVPNIGR